jgi:SYP7 family syntaxin
MNAELRKDKQFLLEELPALRQLVSSKDATPEAEQERLERYEEAKRAVEDVSDNATGGPTLRPQRTELGSDGRQYTRTVMLDGEEIDRALSNPEAYQHTAQTSEFVREAKSARERQDVALDHIELGLSTLKELGTAMGEELERHDRIIDEVETKMDSATKDMRNNNARLKGLVTQVRSTRRFFIDLILICVVLALGLFIYEIVAHP